MMKTMNKLKVEKKDRELVLSRMFDAPRELVFEMYSKCEHIRHWWGPGDWPVTYCKMDFRVNGNWHYCMSGPDGKESWGKGIYQEIVRPEKIAWQDYFSDKDGTVNEKMPGMLIIVELADENGKTRMTSHTHFSNPEQMKQILDMGVVEGITMALNQLEAYLVGKAGSRS
jgi:uncharacterized protein YndB with AHSA1/START domain